MTIQFNAQTTKMILTGVYLKFATQIMSVTKLLNIVTMILTDFDRGEYDCLKGYPHQMYESEEYDNGYAQQYASEQKNPNLDPE